MAKIPLSLKLEIPKNFWGLFIQNLGWIFFAIFLILVVFELFEIKNSVDIILSLNNQQGATHLEKGVRINFDDYNNIVQRIQNAQNYVPTGGITHNPFVQTSPAPIPLAPVIPLSTSTPGSPASSSPQ